MLVFAVSGWDASKPGPREPWHDIHSRIDGPVALDVLLNFVERWAKQAGSLHKHKINSIADLHNVNMPMEKFQQFLVCGQDHLALSCCLKKLQKVYKCMNASWWSQRALCHVAHAANDMQIDAVSKCGVACWLLYWPLQ